MVEGIVYRVTFYGRSVSTSALTSANMSYELRDGSATNNLATVLGATYVPE